MERYNHASLNIQIFSCTSLSLISVLIFLFIIIAINLAILKSNAYFQMDKAISEEYQEMYFLFNKIFIVLR